MVHILLVDDEPAVRKALRAVLESAGMDVAESDGEGSLRALQDGRFDLVLCDLFMPNFDGIELIRQLRRESSGVKIVAMSGEGADLLPVASMLGAKEVLRKPFDNATLLATIARVLR